MFVCPCGSGFYDPEMFAFHYLKCGQPVQHKLSNKLLKAEEELQRLRRVEERYKKLHSVASIVRDRLFDEFAAVDGILAGSLNDALAEGE